MNNYSKIEAMKDLAWSLKLKLMNIKNPNDKDDLKAEIASLENVILKMMKGGL